MDASLGVVSEVGINVETAGQVQVGVKLEEFLNDVHLSGERRPIMYGSTARRFQIWRLRSGSDDFLRFCAEARGIDRLRKNSRGKYDVDIAVPEGSISWDELRGAAGKADLTSNVEIDPHFICRQDDGRVVVKRWMNGGPAEMTLPIQTDVVRVGERQIECLSLMSLLAYDLSFENLRYKDIPEMGKMIPAAIWLCSVANDETKWRDLAELVKKVGDPRLWYDLMRTVYHDVMPYEVRKFVKPDATDTSNKVRIKNWERENPVYF